MRTLYTYVVRMAVAADVEKTIFFTRIIIVWTKHGMTRDNYYYCKNV